MNEDSLKTRNRNFRNVKKVVKGKKHTLYNTNIKCYALEQLNAILYGQIITLNNLSLCCIYLPETRKNFTSFRSLRDREREN
jgi:hypothetical protein